MEEKVPKPGVNGKNAMAMGSMEELKGHRGSALQGVFIATGRAEAAVAAERDEFQFTAFRTAIHSVAKGRIATVNHFIHVFNNRRTRM